MMCWVPFGESADFSLSNVHFGRLNDMESTRLLHCKAPFPLVINKYLVYRHFEAIITLNPFNSALFLLVRQTSRRLPTALGL